MLCAKCKTENPDGLKFCNECGVPFKTPCASCGFENASTAKFCGQCGAAFGASAAAACAKKSDQTQIRLTDVPAAENLDGERKTVTMLFADIKGSMDLMEDLDPEEARAIVDPALKLMIGAVRRYSGYVAQLAATASSRCSALGSRMKTIRSAPCTQHWRTSQRRSPCLAPRKYSSARIA